MSDHLLSMDEMKQVDDYLEGALKSIMCMKI